ncbi:carbon-nitrogen hydrolase family protein [Algoriphagus sp. D3-2-R+10]|nr:carbon-nitrogen hydrolase family protein [Algoriphagus sp. D3-2-R+10]
MTPFAIAGIQMKVSAVASNVAMMKLKLDITMSLYPWVEMVVFSELCAFGPLTHTAQIIPGSFEHEMQEMAKKHKIWLLPGSIFEKEGDRIYNTATVINPDGEIVTRYRKMFPFYPYEVGVTPGSDFCVFDVPGVAKFGLSICYDMWFPETIRTLAVNGAEVILHPTMTGTIDRDIELSIVRAMAAVNQCYFFDVNGLESGGNGRSLVCGPDGRIIYQAEGNEEIFPIELNIDRVKRSRELGVLRLGQPLKSLRDHIGEFSIYQPGTKLPYLDSLGPLIKPTRLDDLARLKRKENEYNHPSAPTGYKGFDEF